MMSGTAMFPDYLFTRMAPEGQDNRSTCRKWMSDNVFLFCTLFGVTAGIVLGKYNIIILLYF
ncbi:hypothetical protein O3M35_007823 [Rhynocoris fuscipes]|uniref:Uncharacterized protein n=1 Tax=Rhynocoris fuscipes TaxID=488301 RepID=A0AAW1DBC8_9HEMI